MISRRYRVEKLGKHHDRTNFSCGDNELDRYFKEYAGQDMRRNLSTVLVMVDTQNNDTVVGFYTLSSTAVSTTDFPAELQRRFQYKIIPGTLIGRLAIDKTYQGQGLGRVLLMDALRQVADCGHNVASAFAVVDAKNAQAKMFYEQHGFVSFPGDPLHMYIHVKTIEKALTALEESRVRSS